MSGAIDPGPGYRLLGDDEIIQPGDQRQDGCDREPRGWLEVWRGIGMRVSAYKFEHQSLHILAVRRPITADDQQPTVPDAPEIDQLRAEVRNLREQLADMRNREVTILQTNRYLQDDLDSASVALRDLGCAQGEIDDDIAQCIHDLATRWRTDMTEQRACEIVGTLAAAERLEVCCDGDGDDWVVENVHARYRPAPPKPVTITIEVPAADVGAAKELAQQKGWKVQ